MGPHAAFRSDDEERALIQLDTIALSKFLHVDLGSEPPESHGIIHWANGFLTVGYVTKEFGCTTSPISRI